MKWSIFFLVYVVENMLVYVCVYVCMYECMKAVAITKIICLFVCADAMFYMYHLTENIKFD